MVQVESCRQTAAMFYEALPDFIVVSLIFFAAGAVKGVLGMGLPTIAMGLLGLVMPVASAAALLTVPSLVTNVWQALAGSRLAALVCRLGTMQLGIVCGALLAPVLLPAPPEALGRQLLGACLIAYGAFGLLGRSLGALPSRHEPWAGLVVGSITGVITGFTGVFVLPAVPYLQTLGLSKDGLSQALGLCFTTSTLALAAMLALQGHMSLQTSAQSLLMVLPAITGMWLGQILRGLMSETLFRRTFFIGLVLLGGWLTAR